MAYGIVVIGSSWGGASALSRILRGLPDSFPVPVVLVQHRLSSSETLLADILQEVTRLPVSEPASGDPLRPGTVLIAPADMHLIVESGHVMLSDDAPCRHSKPSIDVTFASAATGYGAAAVGVVLTGANADGSRGLRQIVDSGGYAIVQEPDSAEMPIMPQAARELVPEAAVMPLEQIPSHLIWLVDRRG